jgi:hypothetical protein
MQAIGDAKLRSLYRPYMQLAASLPCPSLDFRIMKILAASALVLLLAFTPMGVSAAESPAASENTARILPESADRRGPEHDGTAPIASVLDLSLFGIISLGVLGLFWIRRHTSEL